MKWLFLLPFVVSVLAHDAVYEHSDKTPPVFNLPQGVEFDCVLLKYTNDDNSIKAGEEVIRVLKGGRVITYPDGYVPVLIRRDKLHKISAEIRRREALSLE